MTNNFFEIWFLVATGGFLLAAPLGPVNVEMIKQALNREFTDSKQTWFLSSLTGIGASSADFIIASLALTIGGEVITVIFSNLWIKLFLFVFNILILGYLGLSVLFSKSSNLMETIEDSTTGSLDSSDTLSMVNKKNNFVKKALRQYVTGFLIVVTSPWSYLWWVSAGTIILFSDFNSPDPLVRIIIVIMFLSGILVWVFLLTTTMTLAGKLPNPKLLKMITNITALLLLYLAGLIFIDTIQVIVQLLEVYT